MVGHMVERKLVCLSCGSESDSFLTECSNCGAAEYESVTTVTESAPANEQLESRLARFSRPVNPFVPA